VDLARRLRRHTLSDHQRIEALEDDADDLESAVATQTKELARIRAVLTSILVTLVGILATVVVALAVK
jgi:hypothetical protein